MASLPKTIGQRFYSEETRLLKYKIVSNDLATAALSLGIFVIAFAEVIFTSFGLETGGTRPAGFENETE